MKFLHGNSEQLRLASTLKAFELCYQAVCFLTSKTYLFVFAEVGGAHLDWVSINKMVRGSKLKSADQVDGTWQLAVACLVTTPDLLRP